MGEVVHLRTITHWPRVPLQGPLLDRFLDLMGEKHSKLAAAVRAKREGDKARATKLWAECKELNEKLAAISRQRGSY